MKRKALVLRAASLMVLIRIRVIPVFRISGEDLLFRIALSIPMFRMSQSRWEATSYSTMDSLL